jgi:hypothetical protein
MPPLISIHNPANTFRLEPINGILDSAYEKFLSDTESTVSRAHFWQEFVVSDVEFKDNIKLEFNTQLIPCKYEQEWKSFLRNSSHFVYFILLALQNKLEIQETDI